MKKLKKPTERHLDYLEAYYLLLSSSSKELRGVYPLPTPTIRDLQNSLEVSSTAVVSHNLKKLVDFGLMMKVNSRYHITQEGLTKLKQEGRNVQ